jgi:DNA invertase Pin-like site-specific DNA recombinase
VARTKRKVNPIIPAPTVELETPSAFLVAGYVRLSTEDSGKLGADVIEAQKEMVASYIEQQPDMRLHKIYCDNGWTGTNFERPGFECLMNDVRSGKVNCIVVKDLSRFGRNYKEAGHYLEHIFPYLGVRFVAINDHFDTADQGIHDGYIVPLTNILKNTRHLGGVNC